MTGVSVWMFYDSVAQFSLNSKTLIFTYNCLQVNEDDMKKIASLPSDYFVHVKDDEKKMVAMVGHILMNHLG